jgi:hypothetical protein
MRKTKQSTRTLSLYGDNGGLSKASELLHSTSHYCLDLVIVALELNVKASMSNLQAAVEMFASKHKIYPRDKSELDKALLGQWPIINPFTKEPEHPSIGKVTNEDRATKIACVLRPGEIEYSPMKTGVNYIIRGGGANGKGLVGSSHSGTYVLSGNLRSNNQP